MSKNLIVQFFVPAKQYKDPTYNQIGVNDELFKYSKISVEAYAKRIGCDYKLVTEAKINFIHPTFERMDLFLTAVGGKNMIKSYTLTQMLWYGQTHPMCLSSTPI